MKSLMRAVCGAVRPLRWAETTAYQAPLASVPMPAGRSTGCQPARSAVAGATTLMHSTRAAE